MTLRTMNAICSARHRFSALHFSPQLRTRSPLRARHQSTGKLNSAAIADLLSKPTWSVEALLGDRTPGKDTPSVTKQQLHHLLKLSALPLPKDDAEESGMIQMLESQLGFVQAVQSVDTTGIEPMQSLRDETASSYEENEITTDSLKEEIARESAVGFSNRIVRKENPLAERDPQQYDPLSQAPQTLGPYVVVNTKGSKVVE